MCANLTATITSTQAVVFPVIEPSILTQRRYPYFPRVRSSLARRVLSFSGVSHRLVPKWLSLSMVDYVANRMRPYPRFNRRLVKRYEQWMLIQHYSEATKYTYRQTLRLYIDFLKEKSILAVSQTEIRRFMLRLAESGVSLISARRHLTALRRFYDFLNLGGLVNYVVPRFVAIRPMPTKPQMHLSEEEVLRLLAVAETPREKALLEFLYGTGSRLGEVRCLRITDLDLTERTARVTGKYGKTRVVLLTQRSA